jgi:nucleoside-diphosphate-sugar epimerase
MGPEEGPTLATHPGLLIVNADDWGRDPENTDRILNCVLCGTVSSVSAMVFMEDSERAAAIAQERGIDAGLHLNFTNQFSRSGTSSLLIEHQQRLSRFLRRNRLAPLLFHPGLTNSFEYVVSAQLDEFRRIYGEGPNRVDGHHHMHLCANVVLRKLIPSGIVVRRNFTFLPGEKGFFNRKYRQLVDNKLRQRHSLTDFFFALPPLEPPDRLRKIFSLARQFVVEVETHPVNPQEYQFLTNGGIFRLAGDLQVARRFVPLETSGRHRIFANIPTIPTDAAGRGESDLPNSERTGVSAELAPFIIDKDDLILITGASGFIGARVVESLLNLGFRNLRCFARTSSKAANAEAWGERYRGAARIELKRGNLLSREDCAAAMKDVKVIFHLAAGRGEKLFPDAFMNSVVTTRNLLEASASQGCLKRFVNISSLTVYATAQKPRRRSLDESCPVETHPQLRGEAYCYAKVKQDEIVRDYGKRFGIPYIIIRPGYVYGPGKQDITGRVGIDTFGVFLHLGGSNKIPFTYVDNCAEAIALAGLKKGVDGEVFNVVDDDLPSSRHFLGLYKRNVKQFKSLYLPHFVSYALCCLWERYSTWSAEQLPPAFNRGKWYAHWKKTGYSNEKIKSQVGWKPTVSMAEGLKRYFEGCRNGKKHA